MRGTSKMYLVEMIMMVCKMNIDLSIIQTSKNE